MHRLRSTGPAIAACLILSAVPAAVQATAAPSTTSGGTVTVTIAQAGASGSGLAAILFRDGDWQAGLGSFVVDVDSDPFTVTETIREAPPFLDARPMEQRPVAHVPPGTHNLVIWIGRGLGSYAAWTPSAPIDRVCIVPLTVRDGAEVSVEVSAPPGDGSGYVSHLPACGSATSA